MRLRHIPNLITALRIVLVVPLAWSLLQHNFDIALLLVFVAGASDALDGFLAKHYGWTSQLGSVLDPLADKLLLVVTFLSLGYLALVPAWLVVAVLARDIIIVTGGVAYYVSIGQFDMAPTLVSKLNTLMQLVLVFGIVLAQVFDFPRMWMIETGWWVVLATTLLSGMDYVWTWGRSAMRASK
ncbi:MAG: CDP-alcohol phosphatidyltransferase family protein [Gammaproteobacteria bacterium]|nr:CDP-alcohol phosphatidyltransferase family protein [Gammaproteobacteria bacterium]